MKDFFNFRKLITPVLIKVFFIIGLVGVVIGGFGLIISGMFSYYQRGAQIGTGFLMLILGPVILRVVCETMILFFSMHSELVRLNGTNSPSGDNISITPIDTPIASFNNAANRQAQVFCTECGSAFKDGGDFCTNCGARKNG